MRKGKKGGIPHDTGTGKTITKPSATGTVQPVTNPLDLWYLCEKINYALGNPVIDKDGSRQYQRVVTRIIRKENEFFDFHHPYIGECGYDMTVSPPQPIMSMSNPTWPSSCPLSKYEAIKENYINKMYGLSTADIRFEVLRYLLSLKELERLLTPDMRQTTSPLKETGGWEDMFKIKQGLFRVPDVLKLRDITRTGISAFQQGNIDDIIEIKFNETNDYMSETQQNAYIEIAGTPGKLHLLESHTCQIDDRRKRHWLREAKKEPLYVPLSLGMEKRQQRVRLEVEEYQHLIGEIDRELEKVNAQLRPILVGELCERVDPKYDTPYKLEAPISYEAKRRMERARAQVEMSLAGPMWGIGAVGVTLTVGGMVLPSVPVATSGGTIEASTSGSLSVGANVIEFSAIGKTAAQSTGAASSAIAFDLAAKDTQGYLNSKMVAKSFLSDPTRQRQEYIYWDD
ncbi:Uma2 family endonuclease [Salmonella enterica subsp. salamae serovar 13,22:z:-]|uniref:Uma2 family endonuclease n=1 Tax=Salmonella enterica TaxID=28901 RepID=UPI001033C34A|nr:Uma2 family endonuclease [Salmonella enterica]TBN93430.1 Uma2 family endonuclease [Salmonella enterica subsp. salamae serovar 13,22:z:-]